MITGYYIREHGDHWQLIRQNERYEDEVFLDGLTNREATALYWRRIAELCAPPETAIPVSAADDRPPQLALPL